LVKGIESQNSNALATVKVLNGQDILEAGNGPVAALDAALKERL